MLSAKSQTKTTAEVTSPDCSLRPLESSFDTYAQPSVPLPSSCQSIAKIIFIQVSCSIQQQCQFVTRPDSSQELTHGIRRQFLFGFLWVLLERVVLNTHVAGGIPV